MDTLEGCLGELSQVELLGQPLTDFRIWGKVLSTSSAVPIKQCEGHELGEC